MNTNTNAGTPLPSELEVGMWSNHVNGNVMSFGWVFDPKSFRVVPPVA